MRNLSVAATALAIALGTGAWLSGPAAAQQLQYACDENGDGMIDASESRTCTEREFDELAAGEEVLTEEGMGAVGEGAGDRTFSEVDANADGEVSREAWTGGMSSASPPPPIRARAASRPPTMRACNGPRRPTSVPPRRQVGRTNSKAG